MTTLAAASRKTLMTLAVTALVACADESGRFPISPEASLAKGGGTGAPKVNSADPSSGEQGQRLNVRVLGSGFNPTAVASWERGGVVDPGVTVHSTSYVSSSEVVADITIADEADVDLYDVAVEVTASDGSRKKGVGVEKFEVLTAPHDQNSTAEVTGALVTDGPQGVFGVEDATSVSLSLGGNGQQGYVFRAALKFVTTYNTYRDAVRLGQPPCGYDPADKPGTTDDDRRARLFAKLVDPAFRDASAFHMKVDKTQLGVPSANNLVAMHWTAGDSLFTMQINEATKLLPGALPTANQVGPHTWDVFGGPVKIIDRTGRPGRDFLWLVCPNLDVQTWTWYPPVP